MVTHAFEHCDHLGTYCSVKSPYRTGKGALEGGVTWRWRKHLSCLRWAVFLLSPMIVFLEVGPQKVLCEMWLLPSGKAFRADRASDSQGWAEQTLDPLGEFWLALCNLGVCMNLSVACGQETYIQCSLWLDPLPGLFLIPCEPSSSSLWHFFFCVLSSRLFLELFIFPLRLSSADELPSSLSLSKGNNQL